MGHVLELGERLLPCQPCPHDVPGRLVAVPEVVQCDRAAGSVAHLAQQGERATVVVDGLRVATEVVVGVAETVQCVGLAVDAVDRPGDGERLLAAVDAAPVVAQLAVVPADRVQGDRDSVVAAGGPEVLQRALRIERRVRGTSLTVHQQREVEVDVGAPGEIAGPSEGVEGEQVILPGLLELVARGVGLSEKPQRLGQSCSITAVLGGRHGDVLRQDPLAPTTAMAAEGGQGPGQLVGVRVVPGCPAAPTAATRAGSSAVNQAMAASASGRSGTTTPGAAGGRVSDSRLGDSSISAACAVCK